MTKSLSFILKKELKDYMLSYKVWITLLLITFFPLYFKIKNDIMSDIIYLLFFQLAEGQCIYDSFLTDTEQKGISFFINFKFNFEEIFFVKLILPFTLPIFSAIINYKDMIYYFQAIDLIWIIPLFIFSSLIMFIGCVFSKGAELGTEIFLAIVMLPLIFISVTKPFYFITIIIYPLTIILFFITKKVFYSKYYRNQI